MDWTREWKPLAWIVVAFLACFYVPVGSARFDGAVIEALRLVKWYAREHVVLCLVPAFFIAGAIGVFISQGAVMKYLGAGANKAVAYGVASVSGAILAVCSCTVLPLFAGIHRMGAGLGPASAFLYAGPAVNVLAIILTARVLGPRLGIARAVGAVAFSVVIGLAMSFLFRKEERERATVDAAMPASDDDASLWRTVLLLAPMIAVLVFANWGEPRGSGGVWEAIYSVKWPLSAMFGLTLAAVLVAWHGLDWRRVACVVVTTGAAWALLPDRPLAVFGVAVVGLSVVTALDKGESGEWFAASWAFARQIAPLLLAGVLVAGALLGFPGREGAEGLIPAEWVRWGVGGNSLSANLFASVAGAFMYFATLTEVPILAGLMNNGMGQGPALALLLSGPALSLPNMLVIASVLGARKTIAFVLLVIAMSTMAGVAFGALVGTA